MSYKLAVRMPNWVGDALMAWPALRALQQAGIECELYGKPWLSDLFSEAGLHCYALPKAWRKASKVMRQSEADYCLLLPNSFSSAVVARLAGKKTIGYNTDARLLLLRKPYAKRTALHEAEYFYLLAEKAAMQVLEPVIARRSRSNPDQINCRAARGQNIRGSLREGVFDGSVPLPISEAAKKHAQKRLREAKIMRPFWVLCPTAVGTNKKGQSKVWPHWSALANKLTEKNITLVACPGPGEKQIMQQLLPQAVILDELNLSEYAAVMQMSEQVIANDSGPMHLAAAVHANVLGLFGVTDPKRTRPSTGAYLGSVSQWASLDSVLAQFNLRE